MGATGTLGTTPPRAIRESAPMGCGKPAAAMRGGPDGRGAIECDRPDMTSSSPTRVVIVGGGIGGLEAMFALRSLAGYRVFLTLLTPDPVFRYLRPDRHDRGGLTVPYDDLVLAVGAHRRAPYGSGVTFRGLQDAEAVHGLIQDVELSAVESVVFVVPSGTAWPLPLYELALLTAERAHAMGVDVTLTLVTPEERPLGYFGLDAAATVEGLLPGGGHRAADLDARARPRPRHRDRRRRSPDRAGPPGGHDPLLEGRQHRRRPG